MSLLNYEGAVVAWKRSISQRIEERREMKETRVTSERVTPMNAIFCGTRSSRLPKIARLTYVCDGQSSAIPARGSKAQKAGQISNE
jgi:hypothetical protein